MIIQEPFLATNTPNTNSLKFVDCIATNDYNDIPTTTAVSNGFSILSNAQNVIFENCESQGHTQNGFLLSTAVTYQQDPTVNRGVIFNDCTSQGNKLNGFSINRPFNQVSLNDCISNNNGIGYEFSEYAKI